MKYQDGTEILLGDVVTIQLATEKLPARVVMLGASYEHLDIDDSFLSWVIRDKVLDNEGIVIEWINENPFDHQNLNFAPVGNYMFTGIDSQIELIRRSEQNLTND